ncbi:MAG: hypothetical protein K1X78_13135 [Verrucomicrobiaceae bacterium]|nr:hypothetical protein [Verrucomicrobiaceae bacterium]
MRDSLDPATGRWTPISDSLENLQMRGIAVSGATDPSNYLVAANALGLVYESNDLGQSWTRFSNDSFVYIRRLFMEDRMVAPRPAKGQVGAASRVIVVHVAGRTGYHRIRKVNGAVIGTDRLYPLLPTHAPDVLDALRHPTQPGVHFIGVRGQGIYRSTDDGRTWTLVIDWAAAGNGTVGARTSPMIRLAISPDGQRVVAKMGLRVIISDRGGEAGSWTATLNDPAWTEDGGSDIGYRGNYSGLRGEWTNAIAIHPTDWRIMAVGQATLHVTKDGGATWTNDVPCGHEDVQSLAFTATGDRLLVANDGGVFSLSTASLGDRKDLNNGLVTMQFYRNAINGNVVIGAADHQGIRGTLDVNANHPTWSRATRGDSGYGNDALENDFVFANPGIAGRFFIAFQTRDLLRLRFPFSSPPNTEDLLAMSDPSRPLRPFTMITNNNPVFNQLNYAVGTVAFGRRAGSGTMLCAVHERQDSQFGIAITESRNAEPTGGPPRNASTGDYPAPVAGFANWRPSFTGSNVPVVSVLFSEHTADRALALQQHGRVIANANPSVAANTWNLVGNFAVGANEVARQLIEDPTNATRLYALTHQRVMRSTDGGTTWTAVGGGSLPNAQLNCLAAHGATLYLATATDVMRSTDQGATWTTIGQTLPNAPVMQLQISNGFLYASTFGRGLWRLSL